MSDFDIPGAKQAGYSDAEIADHLAKTRNFDAPAARKAGYSDADILGHLTTPAKPQSAARVVNQAGLGLSDSVAGLAGAPVDLATWALNKVLPQRPQGVKDLVTKEVMGDAVPVDRNYIQNPLGGSESIKKGFDYLATAPGRVVDAVSQGSFAPLTDDRTSRFEPETRAEKIARSMGDATGNALSILLPAGMIAKGMQGAGAVTQTGNALAVGAPRAATTGGRIAETLAAQPVAQTGLAAAAGATTGATDSPGAGLAVGLAAPLGLAAARRVVTPVRNALTAQERRLVTAADEEGIPLTPAQRTGSPALKGIEGTMAKIPGASGPMQETFTGQRQQFNRATLERAGVTATDASPETMERAFRSAGQTFDDLAARTTLNVDRQFAQDIGTVINDYGRRLPTDVAPVFRSYVDDLAPMIQAAANGQSPQIAGDVYATMRSSIGRRIRAAHSNPDLQEALGGLQQALDGAVERSTSGPLRREWQEARREYQALMTVDKAMQGGSQVDRAAGNIPLGALKGAVQQSDRAGFSRGRGQLNEMARVGDFIGTRVPDSGTGTRNAVANPLMWPVMLGGNVLSRGYNSGPMQRYLSNELMDPANLSALYGSGALRQAEEELAGGPNALSRRGAR